MSHTRIIAATLCVLSSISIASAQKSKISAPVPDHFEIGRDTFFDFGPPFDYFELLLVRSKNSGSAVQRIILTPAGDSCLVPAKVETSSVLLNESVSTLLGNANPCAIPEKELHRELKRCKHCMVFSGVDVTMRVPCGATTRLIRSDILDRDLFAATPDTPEHTSWTMQLLARLDQVLGPGVMEKPAFSRSGRGADYGSKLGF